MATIDDLLDTYKTLHSAEKVEDRSNLATAVQRVFNQEIDKFLFAKHGGKTEGVPAKYSLGSKEHNFADAREDAEDMWKQIGLSLIAYGHPNNSDEQNVATRIEYENDPSMIDGMMYAKFGLTKSQFVDDLIENKENVWNSRQLPNLMSHAGSYSAAQDIRHHEAKLFRYEHADHLRRHLADKLKEADPAYKAHTDNMDMNDLKGALSPIYRGVKIDQVVKDNPKHLYKSDIAVHSR